MYPAVKPNGAVSGSRDVIHPDFLDEYVFTGERYLQCKQMWDECLAVQGGDPDAAVIAYGGVLLSDRTYHADQIQNQTDLAEWITLAMFPVMGWVVEKATGEDESVSSMIEDQTFQRVVRILICILQGYHPTQVGNREVTDLFQSLMPTCTAFFINRLLARHGRRIYRIAPTLELALLNTQLRGYPADELRLPVACIYIHTPKKFQIYNADTGWHTCDGAYLSEYQYRDRRIWKVLLIGGSNNLDQPLDDALWFFTVGMEDAVSVEGCLEASMRSIDAHTVVRDSGQEKEIRASIIDVFRYLMNVVIYCTRPDADLVMRDASLEYQRLKDRMMKAKGKKREKLKKRLRVMKERREHYLGSRTVIERGAEPRECEGRKTGRKLTVRYLHPGYYARRGKEKVWTWNRPHWRGPEEAPLTTGTSVLVK